MKKRIYYWNGSPNFGDRLNTVLFERLFRTEFDYTSQIFDADCLAIGSVLNILVISKSVRTLARQLYSYAVHRKGRITVLGAGFIDNPGKCRFMRPLAFKIVRGKLTENILREHRLLKGDIVTGDPGLLSSLIYPPAGQKKYRLGLIPHLSDLNSTVFYEVYKKHAPGSVIINVQDHPDKVIPLIGECEAVISSSLHGLIIADSMNIPNLWVENRYKWGHFEPRFKYHDYYSVFGITGNVPVEIADFLKCDTGYIAANYKVDYNHVREKQDELYNAISRYLSPPPVSRRVCASARRGERFIARLREAA